LYQKNGIDKEKNFILWGGREMSPRTRYLVWLIALALFDIFIPIPLVALIMIYVLLRRPPWFQQIVSDIYDDES